MKPIDLIVTPFIDKMVAKAQNIQDDDFSA
jgi:hypothetical protein